MNQRLRPTGPANPFEGFMLGVCVLQGFMVLSGYAKPTSITSLLPHPFTVIWSSLLMFGGVIAVFGLYWPGNPFTGVEVKRVGLIATGFASLAYGVALLGFGAQGFVAAGTSLAFAFACFWRMHQVTRSLHQARRHIVQYGRLEEVASGQIEADVDPPQSRTAEEG